MILSNLVKFSTIQQRHAACLRQLSFL